MSTIVTNTSATVTAAHSVPRPTDERAERGALRLLAELQALRDEESWTVLDSSGPVLRGHSVSLTAEVSTVETWQLDRMSESAARRLSGGEWLHALPLREALRIAADELLLIASSIRR